MKKIKKGTKIFLIIICLILICSATVVTVGYKYMNRVKVVPLNLGTATTEKRNKRKNLMYQRKQKRKVKNTILKIY